MIHIPIWWRNGYKKYGLHWKWRVNFGVLHLNTKQHMMEYKLAIYSTFCMWVLLYSAFNFTFQVSDMIYAPLTMHTRLLCIVLFCHDMLFIGFISFIPHIFQGYLERYGYGRLLLNHNNINNGRNQTNGVNNWIYFIFTRDGKIVQKVNDTSSVTCNHCQCSTDIIDEAMTHQILCNLSFVSQQTIWTVDGRTRIVVLLCTAVDRMVIYWLYMLFTNHDGWPSNEPVNIDS